MRTELKPHQLNDPHMAAVEKNLRACVHCGICTATCPTYLLTGDERDGPRGRIVMMQRMLEQGGLPTAETVHHLDRCLSCLGCRTACPSSVDYARLIDQARAHIHETYHRPLHERALRAGITFVLARPKLVTFGMRLARLFAPIATRLPGALGAMAKKAVRPADDTGLPHVRGSRRIALMQGCVQQALAPSIDQAATRVLARRDIAAVPLDGAGCCGALAHHLGRRDEAKRWAKRAIAAFEKFGEEADGAEAVLITATGCAAHLADYGELFCDEPDWQPRARAFAAKVKDFSELATQRMGGAPEALRIAHHIPCSLQHGLRRGDQGAALAAAGYAVADIPESHICCGSAGSYSLLQPEMAAALRQRKLDNIATLHVDAIASANIGCLFASGGPGRPARRPSGRADRLGGGRTAAAGSRGRPQDTLR